MSALKLAGLQDDTPVKMTIELPADIHRDLVLYAEVLSGDGERAYSPDIRAKSRVGGEACFCNDI